MSFQTCWTVQHLRKIIWEIIYVNTMEVYKTYKGFLDSYTFKCSFSSLYVFLHQLNKQPGYAQVHSLKG